MSQPSMTPEDILSRLNHPRFKSGSAGIAFTTRGETITIWAFDGALGARWRDVKIGEVRGRTWTADDIYKTFTGRNWRANLCAEIDAAIMMAMERRGATW